MQPLTLPPPAPASAPADALTPPVFFRHDGRVLGYRQRLVGVDRLAPYRMREAARIEACGPCSVRQRCWACPGLNDALPAYAAGYARCLLYVFFTPVDYTPPCPDPYQRVQEAYRVIASYATIYGRVQEARLAGKDMIDGRCAYCYECTAAASPPRPCAHPPQLRASLEALGINVGRLSNELLEHPLDWYVRKGGRLPATMSVVHGLLTDAHACEVRGVDDPEVSRTARGWLAAWWSRPGEVIGVPVVPLEVAP